MRATLLMIALGSIGLAGCQSLGSNGAPPVTGSTTPAGAATSGLPPRPQDSCPGDSDRRCARRRPRRAGRRVAVRQRPPGGLGRPSCRARFESKALVARRPWRIWLYRAGRRDG